MTRAEAAMLARQVETTGRGGTWPYDGSIVCRECEEADARRMEERTREVDAWTYEEVR
jgi:mRNA-degrading endonuclease toxin of MazEF toxin-antitoxin module